MMLKLVIFIVLSSAANGVLAQGCPYGMPTTPGCIPPDQLNQSGQPQQDVPINQPRWAKTWGAIAIDGTLGKLGAATGMANRRQAEQAAIAQCISNQGGEECKLKSSIWSFRNQCAATAWGDIHVSRVGGETIEVATDSALKECKKYSLNCRIVYADCSRPMRIR